MNITDLPLELREYIIVKYDYRDIIENSNNEELIYYFKDSIKLMMNEHWRRYRLLYYFPNYYYYKYHKIMTKHGHRVLGKHDIICAIEYKDHAYIKWMIDNCNKFYKINELREILCVGHQYNNYTIINHINKKIYNNVPIHDLLEKCIWKYIAMTTTKKYKPSYDDINTKVQYGMMAFVSICGILLYCKV